MWFWKAMKQNQVSACRYQGADTERAPASAPTLLSGLREEGPWDLIAAGCSSSKGTDKDALISGLNLLDRHIQQMQNPLEQAAGSWFRLHPLSARNPYAVSLIAETPEQLKAFIAEARDAVNSGTSRRISGRFGFIYSPRPMGASGDIAFVFPRLRQSLCGHGKNPGRHLARNSSPNGCGNASS